MNTFWHETGEGTVLRILDMASPKHLDVPPAGTERQV